MHYSSHGCFYLTHSVYYSNGACFCCRLPHATATDKFNTLSLTYLDRLNYIVLVA